MPTLPDRPLDTQAFARVTREQAPTYDVGIRSIVGSRAFARAVTTRATVP